MENEMKPEIRFKEFTNAWEQHGILSSNRDSGHAESLLKMRRNCFPLQAVLQTSLLREL